MINYQEIYYTFKHFSECELAFLEKNKVKQTIEATLWLIFLFFPPLIQSHVPENGYSALITYSVLLFFGFISIPRLARKILTIYLLKFNKDLNKKSALFEKYQDLIKSSVLAVLNEGSDSFKGDFLQKIKEKSTT